MTKKSKKEMTPTALNSSAPVHATFWERNEASDGILLKETIKKYAISIFRSLMIIQPNAWKNLFQTSTQIISSQYANF